MGRVKNIKKLKKFTVKMQAKLLLVFCVVIIAMIALIVKLVFINQKDGERYAKKVLSQQTYQSSLIPYRRGEIRDRKGTVLATSQKVYNIILDVNHMLSETKYLDPTVAAITSTYEKITKASLDEIISTKSKSRYVILQKGISADEMNAFKEKAAADGNIQGIWFEEDYVRNYPYSTLGSSILGFTISGNEGSWGLEQFYNSELNGINGREYGYIDEELKLSRTVKPAVHGNSLISTIEANVQGIVQNHIKTFNSETGSKNIGVVVMNPNNGEIYAMASNAEYNLNKPADLTYLYSEEEIDSMSEEERQAALNTMWRNYAISDTFEPGSTFKPFTVASALDEGIVGQHDTFFCDGYEMVGGWMIKCSSYKKGGHGHINLTESLMLSCNDTLMHIVEKEGNKLFYRYQRFFGFGQKTGIDLPGEASGILINGDNMTSSDLATSSFGQTFTNTMIQLAAGYSALINGGYYYEPHLVKQIVNENGAIVKQIDKVLVKEVTSRSTSQFIKNAMYLTVKDGTAKGANVAGYQVGGKTGTAQKQPRAEKKYVVSFIGAVPALNPEVVIYVVIDEPTGYDNPSSSIATEFASRILKDILPFLEIYPSEEFEEDAEYVRPTLPTTNTGGQEEEAEGESGQDSNDEDGTADNGTTNDGEGAGDGTETGTNTDNTTDQDTGTDSGWDWDADDGEEVLDFLPSGEEDSEDSPSDTGTSNGE